MPTPPKTSPAAIVAAARDLIAEHGLDSLSMQSVAERVGVRGPSLYKHLPGRAALLKAVELSVVADLEVVIVAAAAGERLDDKDALRAIASAFRRFAQEVPAQYKLLFQLHSSDPETEAARSHALLPALERLHSLLGNRELAFVRAQALTAFLHGFASMELAGAFRVGGNVDEAFATGIELLLKKPKK